METSSSRTPAWVPLRHPDRFGELLADLAGTRAHEVFGFLAQLRVAGIVEEVLHFLRIVGEIVELTRAGFELEGALPGLRAHGAELQRDTAARRMYVPLHVSGVARLLLTRKERHETAALHVFPGGDAGEIAEGRVQVERRDGLRDDAPRGDSRSARDHGDAQQVFVRRRAFQIQAVIAEELAVVGRVDDERVLREAEIVER